MNNRRIQIEIEDGEVKRILDRLEKAQEEIACCYGELEDLGVLVVKEPATE